MLARFATWALSVIAATIRQVGAAISRQMTCRNAVSQPKVICNVAFVNQSHSRWPMTLHNNHHSVRTIHKHTHCMDETTFGADPEDTWPSSGYYAYLLH